MIHNLPVYPPSNSFQSREKGLCGGLIGCTFYAVFWSLSEIVRRGPWRPWTHETERRTTKHQSVLSIAHPQHPAFLTAAVFSFCPFFTPLSLSHSRLKTCKTVHPSTILGIAHSRNHTHTHGLSPSCSPSPALYIAMVLGSVSANDFRKMPSSEKRKKRRKDKKAKR